MKAKPDMSHVYMLSGISGSGKSTFINKVAPHALYLNADSIRKELTGDESDQSVSKQAFEILFERFRNALIDNVDVIIDNTCLRIRDRKQYYDIIRDCEYSTGKRYVVILYSFVPNLEQSLHWNSLRDRKVPDDVIRRQFKNFEPPSEWERYSFNVKDIVL